MKEKRPPRSVIIPAPIWLVSFGDTVALMLAFFVMLFAMSSLEESKVARLIAAVITEEIDITNSQPMPNSNFSIENVQLYQGISVPYIYELLKNKIDDLPILNGLVVRYIDHDVQIILPEDIFDTSAGMKISGVGTKIINELGLILATINNVILIEGYSTPIDQNKSDLSNFSNRWEMRLLRAVNVAQKMRESGLLASTKILGWSEKPEHNAEIEPDDLRIALRITRLGGGQ